APARTRCQADQRRATGRVDEARGELEGFGKQRHLRTEVAGTEAEGLEGVEVERRRRLFVEDGAAAEERAQRPADPLSLHQPEATPGAQPQEDRERARLGLAVHRQAEGPALVHRAKQLLNTAFPREAPDARDEGKTAKEGRVGGAGQNLHRRAGLRGQGAESGRDEDHVSERRGSKREHAHHAASSKSRSSSRRSISSTLRREAPPTERTALRARAPSSASRAGRANRSSAGGAR